MPQPSTATIRPRTAVAPIVEALREIGYGGYASAEALPYPDPEAAARQTIETFRRFFR